MSVIIRAVEPRPNLSINVVANYVAKLWSISAVYIFVPIYIRFLGVETYGLIAFYSVALAILFVADAGISATFAREAARESHKKTLLDLLTSFERVLLCVLGAAAAAILMSAEYIAAGWLKASESFPQGVGVQSIQLMALAIVPQIALSLYLGGLMGRQKQVTANMLTVLFGIVRAGLVLLPLLWVADIRVYFGWQVISCWVFMFVARRYLRAELGAQSWRSGSFSLPLFAPLLGYASGMFAMALIAGVNNQIDRLVVSKLLSLEAFTFYSLAAMMAQAPSIIAMPIASAVSPQLVVLVRQGTTVEVRALYEKFSFAVAALGSAAAFGLFFFGDALAAVWLSGQRIPTEMTTVTQILSIGSLCLALQLGPYYLSLANGYTKTNVRLGLMCLVITVPAQLYFTRHHGPVGAAIPWFTMNLLAFIYLGIELNTRFNRGFTSRWFMLCTAVPVAIGGLLFFLAKQLTERLQLSGLESLFVAAACGVLTLGLCVVIWNKLVQVKAIEVAIKQ